MKGIIWGEQMDKMMFIKYITLKRVKHCFKLSICILIIISFVLPVYTQDISSIPLKEKFSGFYGSSYENADIRRSEEYYFDFLSKYIENIEKYTGKQEVVISPSSIVDSEDGKISLETGVGGKQDEVLIWDEECLWYEWEIEIPSDGYFQMYIEYYLLPGASTGAIRSLKIDGKHPYIETSDITFTRMWRDKGKPKVNNLGDEVRPSQEEIPGWRVSAVGDSRGFYPEPFIFYLSKGKHKIRLEYVDYPMIVGNIYLKPPLEYLSYFDLTKQYKEEKYANGTGFYKYQAEEVVLEKNDPTIRLDDSSDPLCEPSSFGNIRLNVIGGYRWRKGEQSITWEFDVPEDGLYKLAFRISQDNNTGIPVYRQIAIDGKVPCRELLEYKFDYNKNWYIEELKDSKTGTPYMFYLKKGSHTLTMTVKMGELAEILQSFYEDSVFLTDILQKIMMITGSTPDPNFEYELDTKIPGLLDDFSAIAESVQRKIDALNLVSNKSSGIVNSLVVMKKQLEELVNDPDNISRKLNDISNMQGSFSSWYTELQEQPLTIDYFMIASPEEKIESRLSSIFSRIKYSWKSFLLSFTKDYDSVGSVHFKEGEEDKKVLNVWISRGKEWAEILKEMADESFTSETGIFINMNVLPPSQLEAGSVNALMLAISSGRAPDVALGVGASSPVEFAIREAVYDLSKFEDFKEVKRRFIDKVFIPYEYKGGVFALPETMNFTVLFYRNDIIEQLNIQIPDSWDEVYNYVLPILHQNNMEFYVPTGFFSSFLFQHGGRFYNDEGTRSALDTPEAYLALKEFSALFTNYGVPVSANFYMRMRMGVMPMGIGSYSDYLLLSVSAPELAGRWSIAPVPGHKDSSGQINRSVGGITQEGDIILSQTKYPEEAWQFLKWWTSAETQLTFGREIEALVGVEARWNTANKEAFMNLAWDRHDLDVIEYMFGWAQEMPIVLGGYFTSRHISNAWNRIIIEGMNVRESLEMAVEDINKELRMKQEEYAVPHSTK